MNILRYIGNSLIFKIEIGMLLIQLCFFMIGFLFLITFYLILRLWISDIILKFLIECFTKDITNMKEYPKKEKNIMNKYISIALISIFVLPWITQYFLPDIYHVVDYITQTIIIIVTIVLVYKKIKKQENK